MADEKTAPEDALNTFWPNGCAPPAKKIALTPAAKAVLNRLPIFPGSCILSRTRTKSCLLFNWKLGIDEISTNAAMPSGLIVDIAEAKTSSVAIVINVWSNFLLRSWFFLSHFSVTKILDGAFPDFNNSSIRWVPSIQKKALSLREDPPLNDLNLLTRLLFLLVIVKRVFSMSN